MAVRLNPTAIVSEYAAISSINANFAAIATLFDTMLSRNGDSPNSMNAVLDMNHHQINNVSAGTNPNDAVTLSQLTSAALAPLSSLGVSGNWSAGSLSSSGIVTVNMGNSVVPGAWLYTNSNQAWPALLLEQQGNNALSQVNLFFKRTKADGRKIGWQMAQDVDSNAGWESIFNIEAIDFDLNTVQTAISCSRVGNVSINHGTPVSNVNLAVDGNVRTFNYASVSSQGRYEFGDGTSYIYGNSATPVISFYLNNTAYLNIVAGAMAPQTTAAFDLGSSSFRFKGYYGGTLDLTGNANTAGVYQVSGTQVVGARRTGWTASTGTPSRGAFAAAAAGTASATYAQSDIQGALNRIAALEARLIALEADARAHGLIN